ncbi:MAG: YceI family protein [Candidatus Methylacidiphilales bacterium]
MKKLIIAAVAALSLAAVAFKPAANSSYKVNAEQSTFNWQAKKVTGEHMGTVKFTSGTIEVKGAALVGGSFDVDMTTITCTDLPAGEWNDKLIGHLKSPDFFAVDNFKSANLKIKSATAIKGAKAGANNYNVVADLTIKGIKKEVKFPAFVVVKKSGEVVANASFDIDRTAYDIKYGSKSFFEGIGDKAIDDKFNVKIRVVATK